MRDASEFENEKEFRIIGNENLEDKGLERPSVVKVSAMNTIVGFVLQNWKKNWKKKKKKKRGKEKNQTLNTNCHFDKSFPI